MGTRGASLGTPAVVEVTRCVPVPAAAPPTFMFALFSRHARCVTLFHDAPCCFWVLFFFWFSLKPTSRPVSMCRASLTLAKFPLPMVFSSRQFPMCGVSSEHKAMELRHRAPSERLDQPVPFSERLTDREVCCNHTRETQSGELAQIICKN